MQVIAEELLENFRLVDGFTSSGALQAAMETEFIQTTLRTYETPVSSMMFGLVHNAIEKGAFDDGEYQQVKIAGKANATSGFLEQARRMTGVQFLCFKELGRMNNDDF